MDHNLKLCYVSDVWAYFTTQEIEKQWGDDWNDAPYEHNAGAPYEPCWHNKPDMVQKRGNMCECDACKGGWNADGTPRWEIVKVAWYGPLDEPCAGTLNSGYSVDMINAGRVPWLRTPDDRKLMGDVSIWAGTSLPLFIKMVKVVGGKVYTEA